MHIGECSKIKSGWCGGRGLVQWEGLSTVGGPHQVGGALYNGRGLVLSSSRKSQNDIIFCHLINSTVQKNVQILVCTTGLICFVLKL